MRGLILGHKLSSFYLGGFKVLIVMWLYGVKKFSSDIQFWLGFKPTAYWRTVWMLLPIFLFVLIANKINEVRLLNDVQQQISAIIWVAFSMITVAIFQIKTVARYILQNNLMGILRSSHKYGPLDPDDRQQRKRFDESTLYRQCKHDCIVLSEKFECNHLPLIFKNRSPSSVSSESSLTNLYDASEMRKRMSSVVDTTGNYN